jgi:hypothetical protein
MKWNLKVFRSVASVVKVKQTRYVHVPEMLRYYKATASFCRGYSYVQL